MDSTAVYWTTYGSGDAGGSVLKAPLDGGDAVTLASGEAYPMAIAVDSANVYYTTFGYNLLTDSPTATGQVKAVPLAGGAAISIASGQSSPAALALDPESVYWTNYFGNDVVMAPLGGGAPQTLATEEGTAGNLAVDATGVFKVRFAWALGAVKIVLTAKAPCNPL